MSSAAEQYKNLIDSLRVTIQFNHNLSKKRFFVRMVKNSSKILFAHLKQKSGLKSRISDTYLSYFTENAANYGSVWKTVFDFSSAMSPLHALVLWMREYNFSVYYGNIYFNFSVFLNNQNNAYFIKLLDNYRQGNKDFQSTKTLSGYTWYRWNLCLNCTGEIHFVFVSYVDFWCIIKMEHAW